MADNKIGSGKAGGTIEYLDSLVAKGRATAGAVAPLKTAFSKVLETVDGEHWEEVDVRSLDIDDYLTRFQNLTLGKYNEASYRAYRLRTQKAAEWYKNFLTQPGWTPTFGKQSKKKADKKLTAKANPNNNTTKEVKQSVENPRPNNSNISDNSHQEELRSSPTNGLIAYPFPLSDNKLATLYLPTTLKSIDAQRLSAYLQALVVEDSENKKEV